MICRHPIFQKLFNATFFAKKGINRRSYYFAGLELLPLETLGLLMDAIVCGIDRWKSGRHEMVAFDAEVYRPVHAQSMAFLNKWVDEYRSAVHPVDLAKECRREILANARKLIEEPAAPVPTSRTMFPLHVFSKSSQ
ncbi:hypothetical protein MSAN_00268600 [Mycena sanguinolenta]|uniref:DUF6532 domain-containing protein n=1 Tax=Mycena sanguinolenta TaxID=230812 RepID=A0A8H6ZG94_9AGAR|nr:hypothetical protein MSAN_00268600 [Mycena sanguinolenta]